jgi:hypothetical protein
MFPVHSPLYMDFDSQNSQILGRFFISLSFVIVFILLLSLLLNIEFMNL